VRSTRLSDAKETLMSRITAGAAIAAATLFSAAPPAVAANGSLPSPQDVNWLRASAEGDHFEIVAGKLAQQHGASRAVRALGARLVRDHARSLGMLRVQAKSLRLDVPGAPSPSQQWEISVLRTLTGSNFDHWYAALEVKDHHQDIQETSFESTKGQSAKLRKLAGDDMPMLRIHLRLSEAAARTE
jgi:putative membrane protein